MKIYIAGKITGLEKEVYTKAFEDAEKLIRAMGHEPINPIKIVPENLPYDDQMHICFALVDISNAVMMLENWVDSPGATSELIRGAKQEKKILYYDEQRDIYDRLNRKSHEEDIVDAVIYATGGHLRKPPIVGTPIGIGIIGSGLHDFNRELIRTIYQINRQSSPTT